MTVEPTPTPGQTFGEPTETVDERLTALLLELCPIDPPPIDDELLLIADLGFDSLGLLELVTAMEVEFDVTDVPEEEALAIETVGDLRRLLAASESA